MKRADLAGETLQKPRGEPVAFLLAVSWAFNLFGFCRNYNKEPIKVKLLGGVQKSAKLLSCGLCYLHFSSSYIFRRHP